MTDAVSPAVVDRGPGSPAVSVVGGIHGDEPSGVRAIRAVADADHDFQRGVRFIIANPPAFAADERYLDVDLNRVFPGDEDAEERERVLAAHLCSVTAELPTLSVHSTHSQPDPIALTAFDDPIAEVAAQLPVPSVVDETPTIDGAFTNESLVTTIEAGCQHTDAATETAIDLVEAFLALTGVLDRRVSDADSTFYRMEDRIQKPPDASYDLKVENFEHVPAGTTYATVDGEAFVAEEPFVPILLSECGYEDVFGYRGELVGESLTAVRDL